jgi:hypothetical protein
MDGSLLQMFTAAAALRLVGQSVGPIRWFRPVLVVPVGSRRDPEYLAVILETPGPFCYLTEQDPLDGVDGVHRFPQLAGAVVRAVTRLGGERIVEFRADTPGDLGGEMVLRLLLFGSSGRAELARGDAVLQYVGGRLRPGREKPTPAKPEPAGGPFYLLSTVRPGRVSPREADDPTAAWRFGPFGDALTACREVGDTLLEETRRRIVSARIKPLARRLVSREKLLARLHTELDGTGDHTRIRREAETLAAYQSQIRPGESSVELADVYDPDRRICIKLDPSLPIVTQVQKRFRKAAKLERSEQHTRRRIAEVGAEVARLRDGIGEVESAASFARAIGRLDALLQRTPGLNSGAGGRGPRGKSAEAAVFRRIGLDDMWFVLVGRNNKENDELTFHEAAPTDLWFHAQHVPGSHVVLKSRGQPGAPPARIVERTASIAAYYSKARHSALVPVIYTLRKYVRKPRGAKPGQVICEREKMVMVEPVLPEDVPPES